MNEPQQAPDPLTSALGKIRAQGDAPDPSVLDDAELDTALAALRQGEQDPGVMSQIASGLGSVAKSMASPSFSFPIAGGIIGAASPIPGGSMIGTGIGSVIGNVVEPLAEGRMPDPTEVATRAAIDVGTEGIGGAVMKYSPRVARGIFGKKIRRAGLADSILSDVANDAKAKLLAAGHPPEVVDRLTRTFLLPHQATTGTKLDIASNIARNSAAGADTGIKVVEDAQNGTFAAMPEIIANRIAPLLPKEEVEDGLLLAVQRIGKEESDRIGSIYDEVEKQMETGLRSTTSPGGMVPAPNVRPADRLYVKELAGLGGTNAGLVDLRPIKSLLADEKRVVSELGVSLDEGVQGIIADINGLPDNASFDVVKRFRTQLMNAARPTAEGIKPKKNFLKATREVEATLREQMDSAVKSFDEVREANGYTGPRMSDLLTTANSDFKVLQDTANRQLLRGWIKAADKNLDVGKALQATFQGANSKRVKLLRDVVGVDSAEWKTVRSWQINDLMKKAAQSAPGTGRHNVVSGDLLYDLLTDEAKGYGKKQLVALHGRSGYDDLLKLADAMKIAQKQETGRGSMLVSMLDSPIVTLPISMAGGAMVGGASGAAAAAGTAGSLALSIRGISKLLANEKTSKWILDGMKPGKKTLALKQFSRLAPRFLAELTLDDYFMLPPEGTAMSKDEIRQFAANANRVASR